MVINFSLALLSLDVSLCLKAYFFVCLFISKAESDLPPAGSHRQGLPSLGLGRAEAGAPDPVPVSGVAGKEPRPGCCSLPPPPGASAGGWQQSR